MIFRESLRALTLLSSLSLAGVAQSVDLTGRASAIDADTLEIHGHPSGAISHAGPRSAPFTKTKKKIPLT
jgi:hypothetical protein